MRIPFTALMLVSVAAVGSLASVAAQVGVTESGERGILAIVAENPRGLTVDRKPAPPEEVPPLGLVAGPQAPPVPPESRRPPGPPGSPLSTTRDALNGALRALQRAVNQSDYVQQAIADINLAIGDVSAAILFANDHPDAVVSPGPPLIRPDFTPPARPAPNRNVMLEAALDNLKTAFDTLARAPGGDLGGFRAHANNDIAAAANDVIAGINHVNASYLEGRGRGTSQPVPPPAPSPFESDGPTGGLRLKVEPKQAQVYVDGYYAGIVNDFNGLLQHLDLTLGPHHVEIRAPGYQPLAFDVLIQPRHTIEYRGALAAGNRAGQDGGALTIVSAVYGARQGSIDVTPLVTELVRPDLNEFYAAPKWLRFDPAINVAKELAITYEYRGATRYFTVPSGGAVSYAILLDQAAPAAPVPQPRSAFWQRLLGRSATDPAFDAQNSRELRILVAYFGIETSFADVTNAVSALTRPGAGPFLVDANTMHADPAPRRRKNLIVTYEFQGKRRNFVTMNQSPLSYDILVENAQTNGMASTHSDAQPVWLMRLSSGGSLTSELAFRRR
jgi:hypothetical protein